MSNLFTYTKTEGQGWLVEKPEMEKPVAIVNAPKHLDREIYERFTPKWQAYIKHINTLRRFKYDYPDPGKEMELGKDFEIKYSHVENSCYRVEGIPITQRTYSEQDLLDVWNAGYDRAWEVTKGNLTGQDQQQFFKQKFGIEIK